MSDASVPASKSSNARLMRAATVVAVVTAIVLVSIKAGAYAATNSVAILASLADSALDLMASGLNFIAIRHALAPADEDHRFGHGKAEPLSALGQSAFIAASGILLAAETASRLFNPAPITEGAIGLMVMIPSTIITLGLVTFQKYVVRKTGSLAVSADSLHYTGDILMNLSVIAAIYVSAYMGMPGRAFDGPGNARR
jgi:ferrous-iron efflux pump FieF